MRQVDIVLGLLQQGEEYLLQYRDVGCFGGKINANEAPEVAVAREVGEETTHITEPHMWERLGVVRVRSDHLLEPVQVHATVFRHILGEDMHIAAKEGELMRWTSTTIQERFDQLTPATKALFIELL